jgi:hypothetical protein
MFPVTDRSTNNPWILVPSYDPLIDYDTRESRAPAGWGLDDRPDRDAFRDRTGYRSAACRRPDNRRASCGGGSLGDRMGGTPDAPRAPGLNDHDVVGATAGPDGPGRSVLDRRPLRGANPSRIASSTVMEGSRRGMTSPRETGA